MNIPQEFLTMIAHGGLVMYPLLLLLIIAIAIMVDKFLLYRNLTHLPKELSRIIDSGDIAWTTFDKSLKQLSAKNYYQKFFTIISKNRQKPIWWIESRAIDEAKLIEKSVASGLWILETIVTVAPLLGLLGTIIGMMDSFKLIGDDTLINPTGVTAGVAEALIVTAFGLGIAIFCLFAFNYFSRKQDELLDEMERLGTKLTNQIRLDNEI